LSILITRNFNELGFINLIFKFVDNFIIIDEKHMKSTIKIIVIGEPAAGKTSLVKRFVTSHFSTDYRASIGANMFIKKLILDSGHEIKIQLWDIAGQERWIKMRHLYYKGTQGALILGDLTREKSFTQIENFWCPDIGKYCTEVPIILIANKNDLNSNISENAVRSLGERINAKDILFTSAKTGENVEKAFKLISELVIKNLMKNKTKNLKN
jgi:small GTP-binding protein